MSDMKNRELQIPVSWGGLAAKAWGEPNDHPILALHGWQDNAGTFDRLIPLLPSNLYIVCLDLPGHGLSSHYPPGMRYTMWDHVVHVRLVVAHFNWKRFSILGHSMGAGVGSRFAAVFPNMVERLVMIDFVKPTSFPLEIQPDKASLAIDTYMKVLKKLENPSPFYSYQKARERVIQGSKGSLDELGAEMLMRRGTKQNEDGQYYFSRDLRCVIPAWSNYTIDQHTEFVKRVHCPLLLIKAKQSVIREGNEILAKEFEEFVKIYEKASHGGFEYREVDGNHHVHLVNPENVAPIIGNFLSLTKNFSIPALL